MSGNKQDICWWKKAGQIFVEVADSVLIFKPEPTKDNSPDWSSIFDKSEKKKS